MSDKTVAVDVFVNLSLQGCEINETIEFDADEWAEMSDDERWEEARDWAMQFVSYGWSLPVREMPKGGGE